MSDFRQNAEVVYQIFPDRFCNGDAKLTPKAGAWDWRGKAIAVTDDVEELTTEPNDQYTFFGGDFAGIEKSIPHLVSLGVTLVYLNPIFAARTVHRYDAVDYLRPDSALGSRADFDRLVDALHAHGIKIYLDGVLNHTSVDHLWHADLAARRLHYVMQTKSHAMSWMGGGGLPKLDTQSAVVQEKLLEVLDCWSNVDGWRLDAAHLLPQQFLGRVRDHVAPKPIIAEDWNFAEHYFDEGLADGITNFPFREALKCFFVEDCSPETLLARLGVWITGYGRERWAGCWNYLDNHDLGRFCTDVGSRERLLRALVLKFTLPGTPLLFQGIEFGLAGEGPAEARQPVPWDDEKAQDAEVLDLVRKLSALRHRHAVLVDGDFEAVFADNRTRTFAFARRDASSGARAVIAMNDGYAPCEVATEFGIWELGAGEWRVVVRGGNGEVESLTSA